MLLFQTFFSCNKTYISCVYFIKLDKIYEARHKLLNLPLKTIVKAEIPPTYFSSTTEHDFNKSALVEILSSVPNSPLTPGGLLQNFTPIFPNVAFQNQLGNRAHDFSRFDPENLRYHTFQQQALEQQLNNQSLGSNLAINMMPSYSSGRLSVSPCSSKTTTSGYSSNNCSLNIGDCSISLQQLYAPYKPSMQMGSNGINHFSQSENQMFAGTSTNNLSRHLNESNGHSFEAENRLLTPNYHTVSI